MDAEMNVRHLWKWGNKMARKSRYLEEKEREEGAGAVWRAALYIRLSREDGDKEESDSVANQRTLLTKFIEERPEMELSGYYIDDGWSGTNFDRPDFMRMMEDIRAKKVNCVIVKDLSRFGRNYIETGNYLEQIFPFLNVRFIAVNDMLDSVGNPGQMNTIMVPFKNLINDEYCRDISNKVKSSLDTKRKNGEFIGAFACYGYRKDPAHKGKLMVDEPAAKVVRMIYDSFLSGMGMLAIARKLNELGIPSPSAYKTKQGMAYHLPQKNQTQPLWQDRTIRRILTNQMYCGDLVQGKNRVLNYKIQRCRQVPRSEWMIVENTHEAVIEREAFEKVQELLKRDTRVAPSAGKVHLFAGFLKCADCGRAMNRRKNVHSYGTYEYYICSTYKQAKERCTRHTLRVDQLEEAVLKAIQIQVEQAADVAALLERFQRETKGKKAGFPFEEKLREKRAEAEKIKRFRESLYEDWKEEILTKEEYLSMKQSYQKQLEDLNAAIRRLEEEKKESAGSGMEKKNPFLVSFCRHKNIAALTREVLTELVDSILVHEGGEITIRFRFHEEKKALECMAEAASAQMVQNGQKPRLLPTP